MTSLPKWSDTLLLVGFDQRPFHYPPQGLLVTARAALHAGWHTKVIQLGLNEWDRYQELIQKERPFAVGLSVFAGPRLDAVIQASQLARQEGIRVVWGGPLAATAPELCADSGLADLVVTGRSELNPSRWLTALANAHPGHSTEVLEESSCPVPGRFDDFYPDPALLDHPKDFTIPRPPFSSVAVVSLSRGCRRRCAFCAAPVVSGGRSRYEPTQILDAVRFWRERTGMDAIEYGDDELLDPKFDVRPVVEEIGSPYYAQLHVRTITEEIADWLAESGCRGVKIGAESGSDRILASIRKGCRASDIAAAVERLNRRGIMTVSTFIAGLPDEGPEDLAATVALAESLADMGPNVLIRFAHFTPYPGTHLWEPSLALGFNPSRHLAGWAGMDTARAQVPWVPRREMEALVNRLNERLYLRKVHRLTRTRA